MDANIVSFLRLADNDESIKQFKKKHQDWEVLEVNPADRAFPIVALISVDEKAKQLTLNYYPLASVLQQPSTAQ